MRTRHNDDGCDDIGGSFDELLLFSYHVVIELKTMFFSGLLLCTL